MLATVALATPSAAARRPDVLLIVTDDQRPETLPWMRMVQRRIVDRGRLFRNGMVPTSLCCPSRASILTGLFAHSTQVWSNGKSAGIPDTGGWRAFDAAGMEERTLAVRLQDAGYRTALVGKYLNGYDGSPEGYVPPGWSAWHAFATRNGRYYDYVLRHTDGSLTTHGHEERDYSTDVLRRFATREIRSAPRRRPLFLMFTPFGVHGEIPVAAPRHVGSATVGAYEAPNLNEADVLDKPAWIEELPTTSTLQLTRHRRGVQEALRSVDEAVGALLGALQRHRDLKNTLIIFTSDNGDLWGEHRLRGKYMPYDAATRVPLAIRWDRRVAPGSHDPRLALNLDLTATVARASGVPTPDDEGVSVLGHAERHGFVLEAAATWGHDGNGQGVARPGYCGFRTRRFLYVRYAGATEELYDYRTDPWELTNVASDERYAERVSSLRSRADEGCSPRPPGFTW